MRESLIITMFLFQNQIRIIWLRKRRPYFTQINKPPCEKDESDRKCSKLIREAELKQNLLRAKMELAIHVGDHGKAAYLQYYVIPDQEAFIKRLEREGADAVLSGEDNRDFCELFEFTS